MGGAWALPLRLFLLPWARVKKVAGELLVSRPPELEGGDWARGREVFFSDAAACSKCHQALGQGGDMGPDLSNLIHRDYESVMRDIREPSGALNPDYIASVVKLKDRRVMAGILRSLGEDRFIVRGDAAGEERPLHRSEVAKVTASSVSVMPEGLLEGLSAGQVRDLMTFLLTEPLQPAPIERAGLPVARKRSEVEAVLGPVELRPTTRPAASEGGRKLNVLLVAGPKDHGPSEHDYPLWQKRWGTLLGLAEGVSVAQANGWPSAEQWAAADVAVFYSANPAWSGEKAKEVDAFLERGGGLVFIHFALNGQGAPEELAKRSGLAWRNGGSRFRHGPVDLTFRDTAHPVTRGFERLAGRVRFVDESYWNLVGDVGGVNVLAEGVEDGAPRPLVWTGEKGRGRVFACVLGHFTWTFDDPLYRVLVLRGMAWAAGEPADRLTPLATMGARIRP